MRIEYDGKVIEEDFLVGLVTNSLYIGGFKNLNYDKTSLNDGLLELLLIRMPKNIIDLQSIVSSLINYKINESFMIYVQTKKLIVTSDKMEWTLDGEFGGIYERVEIEDCNKAIKIISNSFYDCES